MKDSVMVQIPVSREAAAVLKEEAQRRKLGVLVSNLLRPESPESDPLAPLIAAIKCAAGANRLTDEDVDAELAAYNAERRL